MNTRLHSVCASAARIRCLPHFASVAVLALAFVGAPAVRAQSNVTGAVYGTVAGATAGTTVTAVNKNTGLKREVAVDPTGGYQLASLPTGVYSLTMHVPGQEDQMVDDVQVKVGTGTAVRFAANAKAEEKAVMLEKFMVSGESVSPIDFSNVSSVTVMNADTVVQLPVERNVTAVALLVPGSVAGGGAAAFRDLASIDGSSVAENAYFVNGFNLTNFRNGMGGGSVPFEFYDQFKIEEGGYSAEYGRSTGGVITATTKRGGNTFHAGLNIYSEPDQLRNNSRDVFLPDGKIYTDHASDYNDTQNANVWASGAIVKNKLFYYALVNFRREESNNSNVTSFYRSHNSNPFWGGKLDWNITDNHTLSLTAISDSRNWKTDTLDYDYATGTVGASHGLTSSDRGGKDFIANYHGEITSNFSLDALFGHSTARQSDYSATQFVIDARPTPAIQYGSSTRPAALTDGRVAYRLDGNLRFNLAGAHTFRFGYDREDVKSDSITRYAGDGYYYRYYNAPSNGIVNGATVPAGTTQYVRKIDYHNAGSFSTVSDAYYFEDNWKLLDERLLLSLGLRNDTFNNKNLAGNSFVKLSNQWAPRLGATYDLASDHSTKLFANYGRYSMPIAQNTNIRFSGGEVYTLDYYTFTAIDPTTHLPTLGTHLGPLVTLPGEDGKVVDPRERVNQDLKPMYQDEYIVGLQHDFGHGWTGTVRGTYRNMTSFIEDIDVELSNGDVADVLTNPGKAMTIYHDFGDGKGEQKVSLSPSQQTYLGQAYPAASRKYYAVDFSFEKSGNSKWFAKGSYTWSHSYGNDEGYVLSDIGQTDAGLTELFDFPQIMDGRYGDLYNDHRHKFKLWGAYKLTSEIQVGANYLLQSGNPKLAIGYYPTPDPNGNLDGYAAAFFYQNGKLVPRGSLGTTPWMSKLDLSVKYTPKWGENKLTFGADLFNVTDRQTPTEYVSTAENGGVGVAYPAFGLPGVFQTPRYLRLSMSYKY